MKKNDLLNGDIVVMQSGLVAVVIGQGTERHLLFQSEGFEFLDDYYNDEMIHEVDEDAIMQVFRPNGGFGFEGIDEEEPIYERDDIWVRPSKEETVQAVELACSKNQPKEANPDSIDIVSQAFYGNRTGTTIRRNVIDRFILGYQTDIIPVTEPIDRTVIHLPGSENLVLIYNKHKEEERLERKIELLREENYVLKPLAVIPELGLELYSRCIVCRMNNTGNLESLCDEDFEVWDRYLAH